MNLTESEKNRIRGLHKENSVIKESWGSKQDEYGRTDGHRHGDVGGHYKDYEQPWGGDSHEYKRTDGHKDGVVDGHYKTYEMGEQDLGYGFEEAGDVIGVDRPESRGAQARYDEGDTEFDVTETDINLTEDTEGEETYHYGEDEGEDHDEEMDLEHDEDMAPHDRIDAIEKHLDALKKDMSYDEGHEDRDEEGTQFESYSGRRPIKEQDSVGSAIGKTGALYYNKIKDMVDNILNKDEDDIEEKDIDVLKQAKKFVNKGVTKAMSYKIDNIFSKAKKKSWWRSSKWYQK